MAALTAGTPSPLTAAFTCAPTSPNTKAQAGTKPFSLAIAGGGIGGLCLAVALTHHNVPVHVYEAAPAFSEIGAGVGLGPNALRAMALLNPAILAGYRRCETRTNISVEEQGRFFNFRYGMGRPRERRTGCRDQVVRPGELICEVRSGAVTSSVHRARFMDELVRLMPEGATSCRKRVIGVAEVDDRARGGVILRFEDGTSARHDAVIGCDGIKSQVRKALLGEGHQASEAVFSGQYCYRGLAPAAKAIRLLGEDLALNSQMYLGDGAHVLTTPIEQGKIINVVVYISKEDGRWDDKVWVKPAAKEEMVAKFADWCEPVKQILSLVEKPDMWALFDHSPIASYHRKDKICLLGDSAHASTPHHGAGAGMAVEDALILSRLLASINHAGELEGAFAAYDAIRRPRSQRLVASSRKVGAVYNFEDGIIGADVEKTREYLEHAWDWIWKEDLDQQLERALSLLQKKQEKPVMEFRSLV